MVRERKTRYATPLATAILALKDPERRIPKRVVDLFKVIGNDFLLKAQDPKKIGVNDEAGA